MANGGTRSRRSKDPVEPVEPIVEPTQPPPKHKRRTKAEKAADDAREAEAEKAAEKAEEEARAKCNIRAADAAHLEMEQLCDIVDATPCPDFQRRIPSVCTSRLTMVQSATDDPDGMDVDDVDANPKNPYEIPGYTNNDVEEIIKKARKHSKLCCRSGTASAPITIDDDDDDRANLVEASDSE